MRGDLSGAVSGLVNAHRAARGLRALNGSSALAAAAVWKARHMARYGYMAHDDPGPPVQRSAGQRITACGYTGSGWGENIAYGQATAEAVMQSWLASPGHRANIEDPGWTAMAVAAAAGADGRV